MAEIVRTLPSATAYALFVAHFPLVYKVSDKFKDDHTFSVNLSKTTSITAAIERYKRDQRITISSWMALDPDTLVRKATGGAKSTKIYRATQQQMTVQISVKRRTVDIAVLTKNEAKHIEHSIVVINGQNHLLNCSSRESDIKLNVMGGWDPLTGAFELYHYEEGTFATTHELLPAYCRWIHDDVLNVPIRPEKKK